MVHNLNIPCLDREGVLSGCYLPSPMALPCSALLSSCDVYLLEPTAWRKGSEASYGVWRGSSVPSIRRQNASGRLWAKAPMVGGGAGFVVYSSMLIQILQQTENLLGKNHQNIAR